MNAVEAFRLRLQSLLAAGLASSPLAARVGLAAASEVWGGSAPRDRPAWYVWLRDRPGAWQLELAAAGAPDPAREDLVARLVVRHYPAPSAGDLARFSSEERSAALASLDDTGTPRIEVAGAIPDALFSVGTIDWALEPEGGAAVFGVASVDRLRTRDPSGALARDVPGWRLVLPAFAAVAGLHAQVERRAAARIVLSRLPGFERAGADGGPRDAGDLACGEAFVLFPGADGDARGAERLLTAIQDEEAEILHDLQVPSSGPRPDVLDADPRLALDVSGSWFGGEHHRHDRALCAC